MTEKKVRATLGDSVIVGTERWRRSPGGEIGEYITISVSGNSIADIDIWLNAGWKLEYIQELPTLTGAIVRNVRDHAIYVRHHDYRGGNEYMWTELSDATDGTVWGDDTVSEGGFEVLFEGVA